MKYCKRYRHAPRDNLAAKDNVLEQEARTLLAASDAADDDRNEA
jgi:hypothetical protein